MTYLDAAIAAGKFAYANRAHIKRAATFVANRVSKRRRAGPPKVTIGLRTRGIRRSMPAYNSKAEAFNSGYSIVPRRAKNVKRRFSKKKRRSMKKKWNNISQKILKASVCSITKRMNIINEVELGRGRVLLPSCTGTSAGIANAAHYLPLLLCDITDVASVATNPWKQLYYNTAEVNPGGTYPNYFFSNQIFTKTSADGETNDNQYEARQELYGLVSNDKTTDSFSACRKWHQGDVNIDLMLYGQAKQDTMFRIDVVRFDMEMVRMIEQLFTTTSVESGGGPDSSGASALTADEWKQFWLSLVGGYTLNPLFKTTRAKRLMKILKTYKFKIPEQSAEFARVPCVKTHIKVPINKTWERYWHVTGSNTNTNETTEADPESSVMLNEDDEKTDGKYGGGKVHPKYRTYLMIRATNTDRRGVDTVSPLMVNSEVGKDPSFDIKMTTKFSYLPKTVVT